MCSEIEDQNTIEHCRLSQCDKTQAHTEEATNVANIIITSLKDASHLEIINSAQQQ